MDYRLGKCSQCGEKYRIPATFGHDVARCKQCSGVVNIGPVQSGDAPAAEPPAAKETPQPAPAVKPMPARKVSAKPAPVKPAPPKKPKEVSVSGAEQKRKQRGTLARLKAQRAEAEAKPAPAKAPAAAAKPAAMTPAPVTAGAAKPKAGARRSGARSSTRERKPRQKQGMPMGALFGSIALVVIAIAIFMFKDSLFGDGASSDKINEVAAKEPAEATDTSVEEPEAKEEKSAAEAAPAEEQKPKQKKPTVPKDPASVDLMAIEDFDPARDTTDEEWTEMKELMATWMDLDAGAAGPRSGRKLGKYGRKAMPVILNHWKKLDFSNESNQRLGDMIQQQLKDICNGNNFGWRYEGDKDQVWFNKKVVENWAKSWMQVETNIVAWINMAKLDTKDPKLARKLMAKYGDAPEDEFGEADEMDDLEVD